MDGFLSMPIGRPPKVAEGQDNLHDRKPRVRRCASVAVAGRRKQSMTPRCTHTSPSSAAAAALGLMALALPAGCSNIERSRNWGDPNVPGQVLVQQVCSTCHGLDGQSVNTLFPKLAGQTKPYIQGQLEAIQARDRNSEHTRQFMWGPARFLTPGQIDEIATYFASRPAMKAVGTPSPLAERGKVIYHQGLPAAGVQACASCHGDAGEGDDVVPRLAGQHQYYLVSRSRIAMTKIMANVSDDDVVAVSAYLESIGVGGAAPATLKPTGEKVAEVSSAKLPPTPPVFDAQGDPKNCLYSVWTYGWYCGSFTDALVYHLKNQ
jgi:cytochrome c553